MDTDDPATVYRIAEDYQKALKADFFIVTRRGGLLVRFGAPDVSDDELMGMPWIARGSSDREITGFWPVEHGILQVVSVPIGIDREIAGNLHVGVSLDALAAERFKALTNSEVAFAAEGEVAGGNAAEEHLADARRPRCGRPAITPKMRHRRQRVHRPHAERWHPRERQALPTALILRVAHRAPAVPAHAAHDAWRDGRAGRPCRDAR